MSRPTGPRSFKLTDPLPQGVTVLEASAGTGKTYTIAGLAARYVAAGVPLHQMLLVTFTRMATSELRERVRERLVSTEHELSWRLAGAPSRAGDEVVDLLAAGSGDQVLLHRDRLRTAIEDFDAATIATTHSFCQEVLGELGTAGDLEPGMTFASTVGELLDEVVDDLYVRRFRGTDAPLFDRAEAFKIAQAAVRDPLIAVAPDATGESLPATRARLAIAARTELDARKRRLAIMDYDDLLTRLQAILTGPLAPVATARLRARYRVVLVDEFQDTDPTQWEILRCGFAQAGTTLVLIADPKQAIYAFRGADVYAYLQAAATAGSRATLEVNWRSDQGLLNAFDALFGNAQLGHPGIVYRQVQAPASHQAPRLIEAPVAAPLRIRLLRRDEPSIWCGKTGFVDTDAAREHIARDLAADLVNLLSSSAELEIRDDEGGVTDHERIGPEHVAVLVRRNRDAHLVQDALGEVGIPAVIGGAGSVFGTAAASEWSRLLEALERPGSSSAARMASLTWFIGWSAERVACAEESEREQVHQRLHIWARVLRSRGVAALMETISISENLPGRMLSLTGGERHLTDVRHIAELMHRAAVNDSLGTSGIAAWLQRRILETEQDRENEDLTRRLESDSQAVQVITIYRSKGLEFPVVYCPFLWDPSWIFKGAPVVFHDPDLSDQRTLDVGLDGPGYRAHQQQFIAEQRGEDLRLAYVALTRAMHQAVTWWAPTHGSHDSALARLIFARTAAGEVPPSSNVNPTDAQAETRFNELAAGASGCISVEQAVVAGLPKDWTGRRPQSTELSAAEFDRTLDVRWRRTSYSAITAVAHDAWVGSEPEGVLELDEPSSSTPSAGDLSGSSGVLAAEFDRVSPWDALPVGADFGTFVHQTLQATDFAAGDLDRELGQSVTSALGRRRTEVGALPQVLAALKSALETPLGPLLGERRLRDLSRTDRLDELGFELPLVGGDEPTGRLTLQAIAEVLRAHLGADDPMAGYAERLDDPALRPSIRGYLVGSVDLVLRFGPADDPRFALVDYKSNWLGPPDEPLRLRHYRGASLTREMMSAHYCLQALLYTVAVHRYLRWRVPGYEAGRHLAGVLYLFVRGMAGADTPAADGDRCGVFSWRPPGALVEELSRTLDQGAAL